MGLQNWPGCPVRGHAGAGPLQRAQRNGMRNLLCVDNGALRRQAVSLHFEAISNPHFSELRVQVSSALSGLVRMRRAIMGICYAYLGI